MTKPVRPSFKKKTSIKRKIGMIVGIVAVATAAFLNSLPASDNPLAEDNLPSKANTISVAGTFEFTSQDPSLHGYVYTRMQVMETLLNVDKYGQLTAGLANSWQVSEDALTWTLNLRQDVKFHDGTAMNAQTVQNSLLFAIAKHGPINNAPINDVIVNDEFSLSITLEKPYSSLGSLLAHYSTSVLAQASFNMQGYVNHAIATGPYQVFEFAPPHKLVVERFNDYWGEVAHVKYASFLTGHRAESRVLQAKSGQADIVIVLDPASLEQLDNASNVNVHTDVIPRAIALKLNSGHQFLNELNARKALSLALDRTGIAESIFRTPGIEAYQLLPESMSNWHLANLPKKTQSISKAKQLLADLGWQKNADDILQRGDELFELTLVTYADRPELGIVATAVQAQWAELGVKLNIDMANSSAIPMQHQDDSLEVGLISRNYGFLSEPLATITSDFGEERGGDWGAMNFTDAQLVQNLNRLQSVVERNEYRRLAQQVAEIIYQSHSVLPVVSYTQQTAVNERITGFRFDPFERSYFLNEMDFKK
ncbi:ABC transporter substrate-binding protein [Thalassotalea sp. PLHSN55]|uniref:ABC transporter substrate-binding protein n=1 Tax=Thalassotalea sp. PLHSN55 TaxID=3435888 RepID=UPI003F8498C4